jgi:hypothetical protein
MIVHSAAFLGLAEGRRMIDRNIFEWSELDRLTARRDELQSQREATPKGRVGLLKLIDDEIRRIEDQRKRHISHLTRHLVDRVAN